MASSQTNLESSVKPQQVTIYSTNPGNSEERNFCLEIINRFPRLNNGKVIRVMPKPSAAQSFAA